MLEWWVIVLIVYACINVIYTMSMVIALDDPEPAFSLLPWELYRNTEMNKFGSVVTSILTFFLLTPIWVIRFFYWLFHI